MQNLTNLNLDHTGVSKSCLKYLKGTFFVIYFSFFLCKDTNEQKDLKNLKLVRLQGIEKEEDDTMDYE